MSFREASRVSVFLSYYFMFTPASYVEGLVLTLMLVRYESICSLSLVGIVQGLFSCFSLSLWFSPTSHVEGSSLTTSLRCLLWEAYRDCFHVFLSLRFPPASHVEGSSLTTSLRYQDLRSFFCNQLAYGRLGGQLKWQPSVRRFVRDS